MPFGGLFELEFAELRKFQKRVVRRKSRDHQPLPPIQKTPLEHVRSQECKRWREQHRPGCCSLARRESLLRGEGCVAVQSRMVLRHIPHRVVQQHALQRSNRTIDFESLVNEVTLPTRTTAVV